MIGKCSGNKIHLKIHLGKKYLKKIPLSQDIIFFSLASPAQPLRQIKLNKSN